MFPFGKDVLAWKLASVELNTLLLLLKPNPIDGGI